MESNCSIGLMVLNIIISFLGCNAFETVNSEFIRLVKAPSCKTALIDAWEHELYNANHHLVLKYFKETGCEGEYNGKGIKWVSNGRTWIVIKKGALGYIDGKVDYLKNEKIQRKQDIRDKFHCNDAGELIGIEIDLYDLLDSDTQPMVEELKLLLEFIFNENNYENGLITQKPYSYKKPLTIEELKIKINACAFLLPDFNSWGRFLKQIEPYFSKLIVENLVRTTYYLISNFVLRDAIKRAKEYPEKVDIKLFFETFVLFGEIFKTVKNQGYQTDSAKAVIFKTELLELLAKLGSRSSIQNIKSKKNTPNKVKVLELFFKSFSNMKINRNKVLEYKLALHHKHKIKNAEIQAYFAIIYQFSPSEFYDLYLDEFVYLPDYFEYYLRTTLGCLYISTSEGVVGQISKDNVENISQVLKQSDSFLIRHFRLDKKVWIHFGLKTIQRIHNKIDKDYLPIFWRALRNYVVLLGGDGILMTFEDKPSRDSTDTNTNGINVRIRKSGFWNLIDPSLEGRVVFTKGSKMAIKKVAVLVVGDMHIYEIFLEIDEKNNIFCTCWQHRPEIVLFYKDIQNKDGENDLIKSLPGCMVSKSFDIADQSGIEIDLEKIKAVEVKMQELDPFKISVFFGGNRDFTISLLDKTTKDCNCFKIRKPSLHPDATLFSHNNKKEAFRKICSALKRLSNEKQNFRELSLEFFHKDLISEFANLLKKIKLVALRYSYQGFNNYNFTKKVLSAMSKNKFMMENLKYLDMLPSLKTSDLEPGNIFETAPLKKITLKISIHDSDHHPVVNSDFMLKSLLDSLINRKCLEEMELNIFIGRDKSISKNFVKRLKQMKLSRLFIHYNDENFRSVKKSMITAISKNFFGKPSKLFQSLKSFHYSFESYFGYEPSSQYSLNGIYPAYLQNHLIQHSYVFSKHLLKTLKKPNLLGFWRQNEIGICNRNKSFISRLLLIN